MKLRLVYLFSVLSFSAIAQKKHFTMEEATLGLSTTFAAKGTLLPSWQPESNNFCQIKDNKWESYDVANRHSTTIIDLATLNNEVFAKDSLKRMPVLNWLSNNTFYFNSGKKVHIKNITTNVWTEKEIEAKAKNLVILPKSQHMAYTVDNNLWVNNINITNDENKNIIYGQSVHRDEFGIHGGIFPSPKGNLIAYYRMDQTMVNDYPIIDWSTVPAKNNNIKYPMAGGVSHQVSLWVYNPENKSHVKMNTGLPIDQYLTCVTWSPDEKEIYIATLNRNQNHLKINTYNSVSGEKNALLFEEKDSKYVQPQHPIYFINGEKNKFVWWSQRDGYMHLYLYNTSGNLIRQITKGDWMVNEILGSNAATKELYISCSKISPLNKNIYAVNYENGRMRKLENLNGTHNAIFSDNGNYFYDQFTSFDIQKANFLFNNKGEVTDTLNFIKSNIKDYDRAIVKHIELKADDRSKLYSKMILPPSFDSNKSYPVIVYLYNGPNVQLLKNTYPESGNLWYELLAQKGYIVFTMDGRGSSNRGVKFEQAVYGELGTTELKDQLVGVEYLKSLKYVDTSRMGIHGWSFGGFMTTSMMLKYPNIFKVGVAGGPVMDWKLYEIMYTERYMSLPENNPKGYETSNLLTKANQLKGKLLVIHGADDDVVVLQHSADFLKQCVKENIPVDFFMYPGHQHNVRGKDRVHLMQKITDYFDLYLKP